MQSTGEVTTERDQNMCSKARPPAPVLCTGYTSSLSQALPVDTWLDQALYLKISIRSSEDGNATVVPDILKKKAMTLCYHICFQKHKNGDYVEVVFVDVIACE